MTTTVDAQVEDLAALLSLFGLHWKNLEGNVAETYGGIRAELVAYCTGTNIVVAKNPSLFPDGDNQWFVSSDNGDTFVATAPTLAQLIKAPKVLELLETGTTSHHDETPSWKESAPSKWSKSFAAILRRFADWMEQ